MHRLSSSNILKTSRNRRGLPTTPSQGRCTPEPGQAYIINKTISLPIKWFFSRWCHHFRIKWESVAQEIPGEKRLKTKFPVPSREGPRHWVKMCVTAGKGAQFKVKLTWVTTELPIHPPNQSSRILPVMWTRQGVSEQSSQQISSSLHTSALHRYELHPLTCQFSIPTTPRHTRVSTMTNKCMLSAR